MSDQRQDKTLVDYLYREAQTLQTLLGKKSEKVVPESNLSITQNDNRSFSSMELRQQTANQLYNDLVTKIRTELQDSYIYKRKKLKKIIDMCAPDDDASLDEMGADTCLKAFAVAIKAIDVSNKMEGHYPRESSELKPSQTDQDLQRTKELAESLVIEHKSEY